MKDKSINLKCMAAGVGISTTYLRMLLSGKRKNPSIKVAMALQKYTDGHISLEDWNA